MRRQQGRHRTGTTGGIALHPTQQWMEPDNDDQINHLRCQPAMSNNSGKLIGNESIGIMFMITNILTNHNIGQRKYIHVQS